MKGHQSSQMSLHHLSVSSPNQTVQKYKRSLLIQVIAIFTICLVIILERVFYQLMVDSQESALSTLQFNINFIKSKDNQIQPQEIKNGFLNFFGTLSDFRIQFLILTHIFITLYVGFDSLITSKLIYGSMIMINIISLIQILYEGRRPFWSSSSILASNCISSFNHPSLGVCMMVFIPVYSYYCWAKRSGVLFITSIPLKHRICWIVTIIIMILIQMVNYMIGITYIVNIAMSLVLIFLFLMILVSSNDLMDKIIKKSTIIKQDAKKYIFYWLLMICLFETLILIVYSGQNVFLDISWVRNFMNCTRYLDYGHHNYKYDEVIGSWFNFLQTSAAFGWIGAIFGISLCYRKMDNIHWSAGPSIKHQLLRILIANILIIPSWIFITLLQSRNDWVEQIGLNKFIIDSLHYLLLYFWLFGYMPYFLFHKLLRITAQNPNDMYVIMNPDLK